MVVDYWRRIIHFTVDWVCCRYSTVSEDTERSEFAPVKHMILKMILVLIGLWAVVSLGMLLWHIHAGQQVRRATKKYERTTSSAQRILLAGDSVIFGVGATKPETSIAGLFGRDFPEASITNIGVSGAEVDGLVTQLQSVHGQHFSIVVIIIGANDVVHLAKLKQSLTNLDQALTLATQLADQVVLMPEGNMGNAPIFPRVASLLLTPRSQQFRTGAIALAKQYGISYVDVFVKRDDDMWRRDVKKFYAADFFHPADAGYLDWYTAIRAGMKAGV